MRQILLTVPRGLSIRLSVFLFIYLFLLNMDFRNVSNFIISVAHELYFNESDSEDEEPSNSLEKVHDYAEHTVPNMTNRQFKMHFRMSPDTFEDLLHKVIIVNDLRVKETLKGHPKMTLEKELMIVIWCLGNMESFRSVADRFGISKSTCWSVLYRTCELLLEVNTHFKIISWPSEQRAATVIQNFSANNIPGVIGAIDGCHIRIIAPKENHNSYVNRKSFHSVLLQGVCDNDLLFTDVYAGEVGSIHDYVLFERSDLYSRIINNEVIFPNDSHLIGDLAYKLGEKMLVGYKNYGNLTIRQKNYNYLLSKTRAAIENAFALLKGRFRRLKFVETVRLDLIPLLITSACILHNICMLKGDLLDDLVDLEQEIQEEVANNPNNIIDVEINDNNQNAIVKRNNIANALPIVLDVN